MNTDPRLGHLLTYTTFHIGIYVSLLTALIGASFLDEVEPWILRFSVGCLLLACVFGGTVGSNIPDVKSYEELEKDYLKVYGCIPIGTLKVCVHLEHLALWIGVGLPALAFIICGPSVLLKQ